MIETPVMQELIISERSVAIFQIIVSEILSELINIAKDVTNNIFSKHYTNMSAPLAPLLSPETYPLRRLM